MRKNIIRVCSALLLSLLYHNSFAIQSKHTVLPKVAGKLFAPVPTNCVKGIFSSTGSQYWSNITLKITNNCTTPVDMQNSTITFKNSSNLNTNFWGTFTPSLSYPDNTLQITSQPSAGSFLSTLTLHFGANGTASTLPPGGFFTINYGAPTAGYIASSLQVYTAGPPVQTGEIDLINASTKPTTVTQNFALVDILLNGQIVNVVQVPWASMQAVTGFPTGTYTISPENVTDSLGNIFQGTANPPQVTLNANQKVSSTVSYSQVMQMGSLKVQAPARPSALNGYTLSPDVTFTTNAGGVITQTVGWNALTTVNQLSNNTVYTFSTPVITFNGYRCTGSFSPTSLTSSTVNIPTTTLSYNCVSIAQDKVTLNVSGAPTTTNTVNVLLTPNDGSATIATPVAIANGSGSATVNLTDGVVYNASATAISGYSVSFNPQPLTASNNATETVTYQAQAASGGRIMTYVPGWKTPPPASQLAAAGYTHVFVAFAVFSTTTPGQLVSAFDTVTAPYISSLHQAGIKVILSVGGASTSSPNTSVNFDQVLKAASSPTVFVNNFIQSVQSMMTTYGFDGIDIDIEQGFSGSGTFLQPTGDIAALASAINQLRAAHPDMLITLTPQAANVSATMGFNDTYGNYSSLIMQTHAALSWVQVQVYNTGCILGIDQICYGTSNSPDIAVALAVDMLATWPATDPSGRATGFQPYTGYLTPSQIAVGYPAMNSSGASDGLPAVPNSTIKRVIQCLRTATKGSNSCDTYVPPQAYSTFGSVFNWEATYDQNNNYAFATGLNACVKSGTC